MLVSIALDTVAIVDDRRPLFITGIPGLRQTSSLLLTSTAVAWGGKHGLRLGMHPFETGLWAQGHSRRVGRSDVRWKDSHRVEWTTKAILVGTSCFRPSSRPLDPQVSKPGVPFALHGRG